MTYTEPQPRICRTRKLDQVVRAKPSVKIGWGIVLTAIYCGAYVLFALLGHADAATKKLVSDIIAPATAFAGVIWSVWGFGARARSRREAGTISKRSQWSANLLTLSIGSYGIGSALWAYFELVLHVAPFPSFADVGYLVGSLSLVAGILLLPGRMLPGAVRIRVLLDGTMVMAALITFSWFFILGPTILNAEGSSLTKFLSALYPIIDLVMLFCVLVLSARSQDRAVVKVRNLLGASTLAFVVADVVFAYLTLQEKYQAGNPFDAGWMIANLLTAQAALTIRKLNGTSKVSQEGGLSEELSQAPAIGRMLLPYALVPGVVALLIDLWKHKVTGGLAIGVYVGSASLLALILMRQVFAIVENSRLYRYLQDAYRELEGQATTDGMTGLSNHRVFQQRLRWEIDRARASKTSVALLLVDVDHFKSYNDQFGHPAGDEALRIVAQILRGSVRPDDLAARYGGEEFAVILPNISSNDAVLVAERIRAASEAQHYPHRAVTLSIGVAMSHEADATSVVESADRALYAAKHGGRNRVSLESVSLPEGWSIQSARPRIHPSDDPAGPLVKAMLALLDLRDRDVERHSERVMRYCLRLAEQAIDCGTICMSDTEMNDLYLGALMHDIGKIGVPDAILHKPDALDAAEWQVIRQHPIQGAELLREMPLLAGAIPIVRSHHERWDGTGYPDGLAGESIPLGARIFALADILDAIWSDRPYRAAMAFPMIREEVKRMSGSQFDPSLVEAFLSVPVSEWERLRAENGKVNACLDQAA